MDEGYRLFPIPFMRARGTLQRELVLRVAPAAREAVVRDLLARWPYRSLDHLAARVPGAARLRRLRSRIGFGHVVATAEQGTLASPAGRRKQLARRAPSPTRSRSPARRSIRPCAPPRSRRFRRSRRTWIRRQALPKARRARAAAIEQRLRTVTDS